MKLKTFLFSLTMWIAGLSSITAQELVEWRGTGRTGVYDEKGLLKEWPAEGPQLLWSLDGLGKGFSSVIVVGDKLYTTGQIDSVGYLFALDQKGKLLWKSAYGREWADSYPGTRTTPVFYKGKIFLESALSEAICMDATTGKKLWSIDLQAKYGARKLRWGFVEAPVVWEDKVVFTPGGDRVSFVCLNQKSGEVVWTTQANDQSSAYCSPLMFEYKGKKYLTTSLSKNVVGVDLSDGTLLWSVSQVNQASVHPNTPIFKEGKIYSMTGYGVGGVMIQLSEDGKTATELWRNTTLDSQLGGSVWLGDRIVGSGSRSDRSWQCLDAKTGQVLFKTAEIGKGAVIYADGLYYCYADNGELGILELTDAGFRLKSKFRVTLGTDQHWAHPVIEKGVLYIRHGNTLLAYNIKK